MHSKGGILNGWMIPPIDSLVARYVECYWFINTVKDDDGIAHPKLNPDTCGHLILTPKYQAYDYQSEAYSTQGKGSHWLFPYNKTYTMDHSEPMTLLGIKFHTGALYSLNLEPNTVEVNRIAQVDVEQLFQQFPPKPDSNLAAQLNVSLDSYLESSLASLLQVGQQDQTACAELLDQLLLPWVSTAKDDKHSELVRKAIALPPEVVISQMGQQLHCSQRTLERSFLRVTGMTLKQCQSINKLDNLLTHLSKHENNDINWSDIAQQFGFSDQPHLIRYLKNAIGNTPREYAKSREFVIDIYGNFE
ncbi:helix-turn-helix domain-containing protein [Shewanella goraebulensis]|uniref:helix-turn-helix domain-containing protein n=1 Tax=Shewanella goraebulensis TaxID=3050637 RepID=UPI00254BF57F|nr:AraC family transcriptional regulator [Shewanella goraebulensis]